jgi:multidrug resistance efflux pump
MSDHVSPDAIPTAKGAVEMHSPHFAPHHAHRFSGKLRPRLVGGLLILIALVGVGAGAGVLTGFLPNPVVAGDPKARGLNEGHDHGPQTVKVVRPRRDSNFRISTTIRVAVVEPYYQAGLRSRVSGVVRSVPKDIGASVRAGEVLVEIDAPDLKQAVEQKEAVVVQREKELAAARAELLVAQSAAEAAAVTVKMKSVEVDRARDLLTARKYELDGVTVLFNKGAVEKFRLEAAQLDYSAALRAVTSAEVEVEKAKVDQKGKAASLERAQADVELKNALVEVARKDRDAAAIQYGYTRLYAPFDGVIVERSTDPGKFVFSGSGGSSEPLITVARTDLVTVAAKVPDNVAPFISANTEVVVEFSQLPGVIARGPVTRFSRAIDRIDQTMRVEVDVYNGSLVAYRRLLNRAAVITSVSPQIALDSTAAVVAAGAGLIRSNADHKGWHEGQALIPNWGPDDRPRRIVPGTTASVRLDLEKFADTYLLPAAAIYGKGGQSYILVVENGVTRSIPVAVQMNDGILAKVAMLVPTGSSGRAIRELTGNEVVVTARQLEVGDGERVTPVFQSW